MMDIVTLVMACSMFSDYSITNAMIQVGSKDNYLMVTPANGSSTIFPNTKQAIAYSNEQIQQATPFEIGITQLPSRWLTEYKLTPEEAMQPCKNLVIATQIVSKAWDTCTKKVSDPSSAQQVQACALSMYKTGDAKAGLDYATAVMNYADAHPFKEIAAPAFKHWEKYAVVPKASDQKPASAPNKPTNKVVQNNTTITIPHANAPE